MFPIRKAIIPVAGLGSRFLPATKAVPKELLPIVDKPCIQYLVEELVSSGVKEIILVTGRGKQSIMDYFDRSPELEYFLQKRDKQELLKTVQRLSSLATFVTVWQSEPLGLGHAILCANELIEKEESFFVCLPDDLVDASIPCAAQMIEVYEKYKKPVVAVQEVSNMQVQDYGIINAKKITNGIHKVSSLVEKPSPEEAPSNLGVVGRYILPYSIFNILRDIKPGKGGEVQLTDALNLLAQQENLYAFEFSGTRFDTGDKLGFIKANLVYGLKQESFRENLIQFIQSLK